VAESYIGGVVEAKGEGGCRGCFCGYEERAWGAVTEVVKVIFRFRLGWLWATPWGKYGPKSFLHIRRSEGLWNPNQMSDESEDVPDDFQMATLKSLMNPCYGISSHVLYVQYKNILQVTSKPKLSCE
jgi:hypothetical protein